MMSSKINCPSCGSKTQHLLFNKDIITDIYPFVRCDCGLVFVNPQPTIKQLEEYYNQEYEVPLYQQKKVKAKARKISSIFQSLNVKGSLLEIGSSYGFFLEEIRKKGFKVKGVELSKRSSAYAKKKFGLDISIGSLENARFKQKFDAVVMLDLIEHVLDPMKIFMLSSRLLKKGGYLCLTTPNIESEEFRLFGRYWEWISPPAHIFFFSPETIEAMLKKAGFKKVKVITYRGDSAGNLFFHAILALRYIILDIFKLFISRKKLIKMRKDVIKKLKKGSYKTQKEFTGMLGILRDITEDIGYLFRPMFNRMNKEGKGATLLVIAKKT